MQHTIQDFMSTQTIAMQAGMEIHAAVKKHFIDVEGGHQCKLCGEVVGHPRAAAAHMAVHHRRQLESEATPDVEAREFSDKKRKSLAKTGAAMPHGGFPIVNKQDLKNAQRAIGRAKNPAAAKAHIRERAKALGVSAGGPGSGCQGPNCGRKGQMGFQEQKEVLKSHGWKAEGNSKGYGGTENYTHPKFRGHRIDVNVDGDYDWSHYSKAPKGDKSPEAAMAGGWYGHGMGTTVESLSEHLDKFHGGSVSK